MQDTRRTARIDPPAAHRRSRRLVGRAPAARGARGGGLPRRVVPRPQPRRRRRPGPAQPDAAGPDLAHPRRVLRGRRRHRDDEHVHGDDDRPGRLRPRRGRRRGDEPRGRAARACGRGRVAGQDGEPALRRRLRRAAQRLALAVAEGRRPRVPRRDLRRGRRGVRAPDAGAARRRRRPAPDRDGLRHAEREGRDRRRAGRRARAAALALVHRRRPERPQPLGPDGRGVLDLGRARAAARRRRQLLARRGARCARSSRTSRRSRRRGSPAIRTPGLPNELGLHDEQPEDTSRFLGEFARDGLVNIVGGCCGTTPEHVRQIAAAVDGVAPRDGPERRAAHALQRPRAARAAQRTRISR